MINNWLFNVQRQILRREYIQHVQHVKKYTEMGTGQQLVTATGKVWSVGIEPGNLALHSGTGVYSFSNSVRKGSFSARLVADMLPTMVRGQLSRL